MFQELQEIRNRLPLENLRDIPPPGMFIQLLSLSHQAFRFVLNLSLFSPSVIAISFSEHFMLLLAFISSPEHELLMVSYCGQWLSVVRRRVSCVVRRPSTFDVYTL